MLNNDTTTLTTIDFSHASNAHTVLKILTNKKTWFAIDMLVRQAPSIKQPVTQPVTNGRTIRILRMPMAKVKGRYPNVVDSAYGYQILKDLFNRNLIIEEPPKDKRQKSYSVNNTLIDKITELSKRLIIGTSIIQQEQDLDNTANEKAKKKVWVISNDKRQGIINLLSGCERMNVTDIQTKLEKEINQIIPQPIVSQHLAILHKENLVTYEKGGRTTYYSLNREAIETLLNFIFEITNSERAFKEENELEKLPPNLSPLSP